MGSQYEHPPSSSCLSPPLPSSSCTSFIDPPKPVLDSSFLDQRNLCSESAFKFKYEEPVSESNTLSDRFGIPDNGSRAMPAADRDSVSEPPATNQQSLGTDGLCIQETNQNSIHLSSKCDHQSTHALRISTEVHRPNNHASLKFSLSAPPLRSASGNHADSERPSTSPASSSVVNFTDSMQASSATISSGQRNSQSLPRSCSNDVDDVSVKKCEIFLESERNKEKANDKESVQTARGKTMSTKQQKKLMRRLATINKNGTVEFDAEGSVRLGRDLLFDSQADSPEENPPAVDGDEERTIQPLQIAMLIVGTRGDVQPFVAIGKHLQEYGHRVRLATHSNFEGFVLRAGLEFYPLGGDPKVLAGYMVKNKGVLPSGPSEIKTQRKQLKSIINSLLRACTEPHNNGYSFRAQAIIANPPTYGHVHVAEALKIPVHIFFTMPWTPTSEFPHPLARVQHAAANRLSYQVVDAFIWWGIRDIINEFRKKKLNLRPITYLSGPQISVSKLPTGYIWSPHLVPKPKDWGPQIDVVGFCFLNLAQDYKPPESLVKFLAAGPPPIYVGFGSLPVEDPQGMTEIIVQALKETNHRGIIDKGWGGIGSLKTPPDSIYLLENCPHDWLFPQCAAVVHHGGAGTTAAGLKAACPTTIVPFFGDQPFWGDRVHEKGVGPAPIPVGQFSFDKLVDAINYMMRPEVKQMAEELASAMKDEDGVSGAVKAFHRHLPRQMSEKFASVPSEPLKGVSKMPTWRKICACFGSNHPL